jgi:hypothetical protein
MPESRRLWLPLLPSARCQKTANDQARLGSSAVPTRSRDPTTTPATSGGGYPTQTPRRPDACHTNHFCQSHSRQEAGFKTYTLTGATYANSTARSILQPP